MFLHPVLEQNLFWKSGIKNFKCGRGLLKYFNNDELINIFTNCITVRPIHTGIQRRYLNSEHLYLQSNVVNEVACLLNHTVY